MDELQKELRRGGTIKVRRFGPRASNQQMRHSLLLTRSRPSRRQLDEKLLAGGAGEMETAKSQGHALRKGKLEKRGSQLLQCAAWVVERSTMPLDASNPRPAIGSICCSRVRAPLPEQRLRYGRGE